MDLSAATIYSLHSPSYCELRPWLLAHADPSTTKLYDRRGYNPEKSASFFANY